MENICKNCEYFIQFDENYGHCDRDHFPADVDDSCKFFINRLGDADQFPMDGNGS